MEKKELSPERRAWVIGLGLLLIVFCVGVTSFALFTYSRIGTTKTTIVSGDIAFTFKDKTDITITNAFPLDDSIGAKDDSNVYEFDVTLSSTSSAAKALYNVTLLDNNDADDDKVFNNENIKVNFQKGDDYVFGTETTGVLLSSLDGFDEGATSGLAVALEDVEISAGQTDKYKLRMWIDKNTNYSGDIDSNGTMTGTKNSYSYSLKVKVDATASVGEVTTVNASEVSYTPPAGANSSCTTLECSLNELHGDK